MKRTSCLAIPVILLLLALPASPGEAQTPPSGQAADLPRGLSPGRTATTSAIPVIPWPTILSVNPLFSAGTNPLFPAGTDRLFKPELLGTWQSHLEAFTFKRAGDQAYFFIVSNHLGQATHKAHLVKAGDYLFLDVYPTEPTRDHLQPRGTQVDHLWRMHSFILVEEIGPKLHLSPVNRVEFFRKNFELEKIEQDGRLLLLCPPAALRSFLAQHAKGHDLYTGSFVYPKAH